MGGIGAGAIGGGDWLGDLDADPADREAGDDALGDALDGGLDELELATLHHGRDRRRDLGVIDGIGHIVMRGDPRDVNGHVHAEGERLLDLALPVVYADDRGNAEPPDGDRVAVAHATNGSAPVSLTIGFPATAQPVMPSQTLTAVHPPPVSAWAA